MTVLLLSLANAADCKSAEPRAEHPVERVFTDALTNTINVRMRVNRLKDPLVPPIPAPNIQRNGGKTIAIIYT